MRTWARGSARMSNPRPWPVEDMALELGGVQVKLMDYPDLSTPTYLSPHPPDDACPPLSARPSSPAFSNRDDQIEAVRIDVFMCAATSPIFIPHRRSKMISARNRSR